MVSVPSIPTRNITSKYMRAFDVQRDLAPVADLVELCFADTLDPDGKRYIQRMRSAARNSGFLRWAALNVEVPNMPFTGYVWELDGNLIGNASLIPYRVKGKASYLIANVAVHPDHRRKGIARALTLRSMDHARKKGAAEIWLHVRQENDQALNLYSSLDFDEKARRTTWIGEPQMVGSGHVSDLIIEPGDPGHWEHIKTWITHNYPDEVSWHLPLNLYALRPGFWGALYRVLRHVNIRQWAVSVNAELSAVLTWQAASTYADSLWLAAPPDAADNAISALFSHARRDVRSKRTLRMEYPAGQNKDGLQSANFYPQQTLIWMSRGF
jgi:ribosomal protein S18 acetylase RimI-like enzyme